MGDVQAALVEHTPDAVAVIPKFQEQMKDIGVTVNVVKTAALPPLGYVLTQEELVLLAGVGVSVANTDGPVIVRMSFGSDTFVKRHALVVGREGGVERLGLMLPHISEQQA